MNTEDLLNQLNELERIVNLTRRGSELAAYKIALDDVRATVNTFAPLARELVTELDEGDSK